VIILRIVGLPNQANFHYPAYFNYNPKKQALQQFATEPDLLSENISKTVRSPSSTPHGGYFSEPQPDGCDDALIFSNSETNMSEYSKNSGRSPLLDIAINS